jgi:hypothetical protein
MDALVSFEPALDAFVFMCAVVIADDVKLLVSGHGLIDHAQKLQPFLMSVALLA